MKQRRHHNNKGTRQIKRGKTTDQVRRIARKLRLPFHTAKPADLGLPGSAKGGGLGDGAG